MVMIVIAIASTINIAAIIAMDYDYYYSHCKYDCCHSYHYCHYQYIVIIVIVNIFVNITTYCYFLIIDIIDIFCYDSQPQTSESARSLLPRSASVPSSLQETRWQLMLATTFRMWAGPLPWFWLPVLVSHEGRATKLRNDIDATFFWSRVLLAAMVEIL